MYDRAIPLKGKTAVEKLRIVPAVVEKDDGRRVVIVEVAYEIDDAFLALMHKARVDVTHGRGRRLLNGYGERRSRRCALDVGGGRKGRHLDSGGRFVRMIEEPVIAEQRANIRQWMRAPVLAARAFRTDVARVNHADVKGRVGQHDDAAQATVPDKTRVLANVDVCESVRFPESAPVTERAPRKPHLHVRRIGVLPCTPAPGVVKQERVDAASVRAFPEQRLRLITQTTRRVPVVVIPV